MSAIGGHRLDMRQCPLMTQSEHWKTRRRNEHLSCLVRLEREADILYQGIDAKMKALGRLAAFSDIVEGPVFTRCMSALSPEIAPTCIA
jgi:hypothetical protein